MPDIRELLGTGAGSPERELDLAVLERRAAELGARRNLVLVAGVTALLVVAVVSGLGLSRRGEPQELKIITSPHATPSAEAVSTPDVSRHVAPTRAAPVAAGPQVTGGPVRTLAPSIAPLPSPAQSHSPGTAYAPAKGCTVQSVPAAPNATCAFTATDLAGWDFHARGGAGIGYPRVGFTVTITHEGHTTVHRYRETNCGTAEIYPGDQVRLEITQDTSQVGEYDFYVLEAGPSYGCG